MSNSSAARLKRSYHLHEVKAFLDSYDPAEQFGLQISIRAGMERSDQRARNSYVYAWCDPLMQVFYIGKGHGRRAWHPEGHDRALRYARRSHAGSYTVHLLKESLLDSEAQDLEEAAINQFGNALTNWVNAAQYSVFSAEQRAAMWAKLSDRPRAQDLEHKFRDELKTALSQEQKLSLCRKWVALVRNIEVAWETEERAAARLVADISLHHRLQLEEQTLYSLALLPDLVDRLTKLLWKQQEFHEIVIAIDDLERWHPNYFSTNYTDGSGQTRTRSFTKRELAMIERRDACRRQTSTASS